MLVILNFVNNLKTPNTLAKISTNHDISLLFGPKPGILVCLQSFTSRSMLNDVKFVTPELS